jgi:hypothetical protein
MQQQCQQRKQRCNTLFWKELQIDVFDHYRPMLTPIQQRDASAAYFNSPVSGALSTMQDYISNRLHNASGFSERLEVMYDIVKELGDVLYFASKKGNKMNPNGATPPTGKAPPKRNGKFISKRRKKSR